MSAPVWAALLARVREQVGRRLGFVAPQLYKRGEGYSDVAIGDNGAYPAKDGAWDPCTGLGIPDGSTLHKVV